jgi:signal transduction histidine kinase/ligand-binding sensor domain-containing protein/DNA-binding response OmpR family regulator
MKCLSKKLNLGYLLLSFLLLMTSVGLGQVDLKARKVEAGLGFDNSSVGKIYQDSEGAIWIPTFGFGIFKYDGYQFKSYTHQPGVENSLHSNRPQSVYMGEDDIYWIGHGNGFSRFNTKTETFQHFLIEDKENDISWVWSFFEDDLNNLWVGTAAGLIRFNKETEEKEVFVLDEINDGSFSTVRTIIKGEDGKIWLGTGHGLFSFDPETEEFRHKKLFEHTNNLEENTGSEAILKIVKGKDGTLWMGVGDNHLINFDPLSQKVLKYEIPKERSELNDYFSGIGDLQFDENGKLWFIGLWGSIFKFDCDTGKSTSFRLNGGTSDKRENIFPIGFLVDDENNIWISSFRGVFKSDFNRTNIKHKLLPTTFPFNDIVSKSSKQSIFSINNLEKRIEIFDIQSLERTDEIKLDPNMSFSAINKVFEDSKNNIWISTLYPEKGSSDLFKYSDGELLEYEPLSNRMGIIGAIFEDKSGRLWIGEREVFIYDPQTNKTSFLKNIRGSIFQFFCDKDENMWVATHGRGLYLVKDDGNEIINFRKKVDGTNSISDDHVNFIYQANDNTFWIGTMNGLNKMVFNPNNESYEFTHFFLQDGLPNNRITGIVEDDNKHLWIGTSNGLAKMNLATNEIQNYFEEDGLLENTFQVDFIKNTQTGHLYLRSRNGLNIFHPDSLRKNTYIPPVQFTHFEYFSSDGQNTSNHEIKGIGYKDQITLKHGQNNFSCRFAALSYRNPSKNQYAYQLVGVDKNWVQIGNKHELTFSNLAPGRYTLRVKGSNNDGVWNEEGAALQILILPPWWWSLWAKMGYGLLGAALLFSLYRYQLKRKLSLEEAKRLKEMDQVKTKLFTNITHEFRTPLTVIQGTAEQEISQNGRIKAEDNLQNARTIQRNSAQLLTLVNQLLDLRKLESGQLPVHWVQDDIIQYLKYLTESFHSHAENKGLQLHFLSEIDQLQMDYDPDKLLYVVSNLLSNAVKFTPSGGNVYFQVARDSSDDQLILKVKDTGIGIEEAKLPKVFDRFYQVDDSAVRKQEGSGIGLSLTKELVHLMGGRISVSSQLGKGSLFTVELPIAQKADKQTVSVDDLNRKTLGFAAAPVLANGQKEKKEATSDLPLVLIIEDNPDVVRYLTFCLDQQYNILTAQNGQIGIHTALDMVPDLIISDVMMPEKDGFEVCQILKEDERTSHIPIILLTAKADVSSKLKGLQYGADAYLSKPFHREELDIRIEQLIELRKKLQERFGSLDFEQFNVQRNSPEEAFLLKVRQVVEENMSNSNFGMAQLCRAIGLSRSQLFRKLKALTGKSTSLVVRSIKLQKARHLLKTTDMTVTEIAYETGFSDLAYFSKCFVEEYGENPSAVKNS